MEIFVGLLGLSVVPLGILGLVIISGFRVVQQHERGVVYRVGRIQTNVREPGLRFVLPTERMVKVDLRTRTMPIQSQQIITRDNVSIDVAAVAYFRIVDPVRSLVAIEEINAAIYQIAQTTVRNIVGQSALDDVLSETDRINAGVKTILDGATHQWGAQCSVVELKDIRLPDTMQRAMAKQAEAEREKRAKVIAAEGEQLSAERLGQAADIIAAHPIALQLRNLQVLSEIATEKNSTIIFPSHFMDSLGAAKDLIAQERS